MNPEIDHVDTHVGNRLRVRRHQLGQSQTALGDALGVSFQQIQKYERGANRVSASMLARAATAQGVPIAYYFDGLDQAEDVAVPESSRGISDWLSGDEAWRVAEAMSRLPPAMRGVVLKVARSLGEREGAFA